MPRAFSIYRCPSFSLPRKEPQPELTPIFPARETTSTAVDVEFLGPEIKTSRGSRLFGAPDNSTSCVSKDFRSPEKCRNPVGTSFRAPGMSTSLVEAIFRSVGKSTSSVATVFGSARDRANPVGTVFGRPEIFTSLVGTNFRSPEKGVNRGWGSFRGSRNRRQPREVKLAGLDYQDFALNPRNLAFKGPSGRYKANQVLCQKLAAENWRVRSNVKKALWITSKTYQSLKFWKLRATGNSFPFTAAITDCKSSLLLPVTRICWSWIWVVTFNLVSRMN